MQDIAIRERSSKSDAGRQLCMAALHDTPTINRLSGFFWRNYDAGDLHWIGHADHRELGKVIHPNQARLDSLYLRLDRDEWEELAELSFALGSPVSHAAAALVTLGARDLRIIHTFAPHFEYRSLYSLQRGSFLWR